MFNKEQLLSFLEELEYNNAFLIKTTEDEEGELSDLRRSRAGVHSQEIKEIQILGEVISSLEKKKEA